MMRSPASLHSCEKGATAAEMAIVLLAVIVLILGMVEFAVGYWLKTWLMTFWLMPLVAAVHVPVARQP